MTVVCLSWKTVHLHGESWISHHRLRYRLFVERQGWQVPSHRGMEHDEFDTPAARYILWTDASGEARGVARLLPTTRPYMVKKLWPDMIPGRLPEAHSVWEATRFGCDRSLDADTRRRVVAEILCGMQEFGIARHIRRYLAVMPVRLLNAVVVKAGCEVQVLGPPRLIGRFRTVAAYLTISPLVLAKLRRRAAIAGPVLCSPGVRDPGSLGRERGRCLQCRPQLRRLTERIRNKSAPGEYF